MNDKRIVVDSFTSANTIPVSQQNLRISVVHHLARILQTIDRIFHDEERKTRDSGRHDWPWIISRTLVVVVLAACIPHPGSAWTGTVARITNRREWSTAFFSTVFTIIFHNEMADTSANLSCFALVRTDCSSVLACVVLGRMLCRLNFVLFLSTSVMLLLGSQRVSKLLLTLIFRQCFALVATESMRRK